MTARPAVVGAFILGAVALCVLGILFFGGMRFFTTTTRAVVFFSDSVAGLDVGAPVTLRGVRIGSVQSIGVRFSVTTMSARIPVYLEIEPKKVVWESGQLTGSPQEYARLVHAGLRAQLALQSFVTGQLRVDLDFRPDTPALLVGTTDVPEIPAIPFDLTQLRNQLAGLPLHELVEDANRMLDSLGRLSDHVDAKLEPLADSVQRTADAATQTLQTTDLAIKQVQADISSASRNLDSLLVDTRGQLDARSNEIGRAIAAADRAANDAQTLLSSLNGMTERSADLRGDLEATVRDLAASAGSLRSFARTIESNPNAVLMGRSSR